MPKPLHKVFNKGEIGVLTKDRKVYCKKYIALHLNHLFQEICLWTMFLPFFNKKMSTHLKVKKHNLNTKTTLKSSCPECSNLLTCTMYL